MVPQRGRSAQAPGGSRDYAAVTAPESAARAGRADAYSRAFTGVRSPAMSTSQRAAASASFVMACSIRA